MPKNLCRTGEEVLNLIRYYLTVLARLGVTTDESGHIRIRYWHGAKQEARNFADLATAWRSAGHAFDFYCSDDHKKAGELSYLAKALNVAEVLIQTILRAREFPISNVHIAAALACFKDDTVGLENAHNPFKKRAAKKISSASVIDRLGRPNVGALAASTVSIKLNLTRRLNDSIAIARICGLRYYMLGRLLALCQNESLHFANSIKMTGKEARYDFLLEELQQASALTRIVALKAAPAPYHKLAEFYTTCFRSQLAKIVSNISKVGTELRQLLDRAKPDARSIKIIVDYCAERLAPTNQPYHIMLLTVHGTLGAALLAAQRGDTELAKKHLKHARLQAAW